MLPPFDFVLFGRSVDEARNDVNLAPDRAWLDPPLSGM
jgi:hypothetical protein